MTTLSYLPRWLATGRLRRRSRLFAHPSAPFAVSVAIILAVAAVGARVRLSQLLTAETVARKALEARLMDADATTRSTSARTVPGDFTRSLPRSVSLDTVVETLQRSAQSFGVGIASVVSEPRRETAQTLPRLDISIILRGTYVASLSMLSEALSRYPQALLQAVSVKRDSSLPGGVETTIRLTMPLRPSASRGEDE